MANNDALGQLAPFAPFNQLETTTRDFLQTHLKPAVFKQGEVMLTPEQGNPKTLTIILEGKVRANDPSNTDPDAVLTLSPGEFFPIRALSTGQPSVYIFSAATDVSALELDSREFQQLLEMSPAFARHCNSYLARLVSESRKQLQAHFSQQASEAQSLNTRLMALVKRPPVSVNANTTIEDAVTLMGQENTGSVIIVDQASHPIGLMTQTDLVRRVLLGKVPLSEPVSRVMTSAPAVLPGTATAYDAMLAMAARGIRHLLLVDDAGALSGVISERDLFALQRVGLGQVRRSIDAADTAYALKAALLDVQHTAFNMLAQGVGAEQLTRFISTLNDAITDRALQINLEHHDLRDIEWSWLAFGSEGREEQTISTDQDNGIVFLCPEGADIQAVRDRLLAFARDVNRDLDIIGFPLCKGEIMASNPKWCMTLQEWQHQFGQWIASPKPEALLNSTIFFDFRPLFGRRDLAERMHSHLFANSMDNQAFQRMLAENALTATPPLGTFRDFSTEDDEQGRPCIDLKKSGARLFVDAARVLALAHGIPEASTVERLRKTASLKGGAGNDLEALLEAFHFIQLLRLRHQHLEIGLGRPGNNLLPVKDLNQLDRRILKEAFKQAKLLQSRLKLTYQL
jgi:CBS domain-containing protein